MKWDAQDLNPIGWCSHKKADTPKCGLPRWFNGKLSVCQCRRHRKCRFDSWVRKIPWRRKWLPSHLVFLLGKFHKTEESGRPPSTGSQKIRHDWTHTHQNIRKLLQLGGQQTAEKDKGLLSPPSYRIFKEKPLRSMLTDQEQEDQKTNIFQARKRKRNGRVYNQ